VEKLARYVDKEEKIWVKIIVGAHVLERISQVASTGAAYRWKRFPNMCYIVRERLFGSTRQSRE
jgi:hypothetical protein